MYAYITLLSSPSYIPGVLVLNKSLKLYSKIPLVCVCSIGIPDSCIQELHKNQIETIKLNASVSTKGINNSNEYCHWNNTFDKLLIWDLVQFKKIVFLDSDMMVCDCIDELFDKEDMSAVQAGHFLHSGWTRLNSGCMVIVPNKDTTKALISCIESTIEARSIDGQNVGDQDVINYYYNNWPLMKSKHLPEAYNVFFMYITQYLKAGLPTPKIIHFVGKKKPWNQMNIVLYVLFFMKLIKNNYKSISYYLAYRNLLLRD